MCAVVTVNFGVSNYPIPIQTPSTVTQPRDNILKATLLTSSIPNSNISSVYNLSVHDRVKPDVSLGWEGGGRLFNDTATFYIYIVG
jgi:hypothetical protein